MGYINTFIYEDISLIKTHNCVFAIFIRKVAAELFFVTHLKNTYGEKIALLGNVTALDAIVSYLL